MFGIYKFKRLRTHVIPTALESVTSLEQTTMNSVKAFKSRQDKQCKSGLLKQLNINSLSMATKQTTRKQIILPTYELCLRELSLDQCDQIFDTLYFVIWSRWFRQKLLMCELSDVFERLLLQL